MGDARRKSGELHQALETFRQAAEVVRNAGGQGAAADVARRAATLLARAALGFEDALLPTGLPRRGVDDPSVRLQEEALRALPAEDSGLRARLLAGLARALRFGGVRERAASLGDEAVRMARRVGDPAALVYALNGQRIAGWRLEDVGERLAVAAELQRLAEGIGDGELALEGRLWRFRTLLELGDIEAAKRDIHDYGQVADALGQPQYRSLAATWTAVTALLEGRFADAERSSEQALAIGHREQSRDAAMFFMGLVLTLRREQGQLRELADLEPVAREMAEEYPTVPVLRATLALLYCDLAREEEARREFERLAASDFADLEEDWVWLPCLTLLAEVVRLPRRCPPRGQAVRAAAALRRAQRRRRQLPRRGRVSPGPPGRDDGAPGGSGGPLRRGAAARRPDGRRPALAHTQHAYAALLLARGGRGNLPRARQLLEGALAIYEELGMHHHAARVRALLAQPRLAAVLPRGAGVPGRLDRARGRGAAPHRRRPEQPRDRRGAGPERPHRRAAHHQPLRQDRRPRQGRRDRLRPGPRPGRAPPAVGAGAPPRTGRGGPGRLRGFRHPRPTGALAAPALPRS